MAAKRRNRKPAAKPKRTTVGVHLPPEILRDVLAGLPVKSILRFRSVCKSWYSLVSCPNFISYHSTKTLNKNRDRVLLRLERSDVTLFSSFDESFMESCEHDDFAEFHGQVFGIVGSCNGLICLFKYSKYGFGDITFFIWNPAIRKVVELSPRNDRESASYFGFGFDSKTSDYKVLWVTDDVCEIYDLSKGVWRRISPKMPPPGDGFACQECYLDGAVHWSNSTDTILLSFNMSDERFRDVKMPDPVAKTTPYDIRSTTLGGLIYVFAWDTAGIECSVWAMKEYGVAESWIKVSNINTNYAHIWSRGGFLWENGEVLKAEEPSAVRFRYNLVLYNMDRTRFGRVFSITKPKFVRDMCLYKESLVLMKVEQMEDMNDL